MTTIITNGKFDLLHPGHYNLLNYCRNLAGSDGQVIVAIDTDERIRDKNGELPIFPQDVRKLNIQTLRCGKIPMVNVVTYFDTDDELVSLIKAVKPSLLVKGSEWMDQKIIGDDIVKVDFYLYERQFGGSKMSSTDIVKAILKRYGH